MRAVFSGLLVLQLFADCPSEKESEGELPMLFAEAARAAFNTGFDGVEICVFPDSPSEYRSLVSKIFGAVFAVSPENAVISLKYFHNENSPDPDVVLLCDLAKKGLSAISVTAVSPDLACPSNIPQATPTRHPIADAEQLLSAAKRIKNLVPDVCVIASGMSYFKELAPLRALGEWLSHTRALQAIFYQTIQTGKRYALRAENAQSYIFPERLSAVPSATKVYIFLFCAGSRAKSKIPQVLTTSAFS